MLKIAPAYRGQEPDLFDRKWFDYRMLHPTEATYLWAHAYNEQCKAHYSKVKDTASAMLVMGIAEFDVMKSHEVNSIWWARHSFDYIGCPYDQGLHYLANRAFERGFTGMPRPNQLYAMDAMMDLDTWWKERKSTQLTYSLNPFYLAENFAEHPVQIQHLEYLREHISKRAKPRFRLVARLMKEGLLTDALAHRFFPEEAQAAGKYFATILGDKSKLTI